MILATHGRALWILDHLEPIQEFAAAETVAADAKLFTPPTYAMYSEVVRDKNYEFWGNQTFLGENPPQAAVISWFQKKPVTSLQLKIADAAGREIREISRNALASVNRAGIHPLAGTLQPLPAVGADRRGQARRPLDKLVRRPDGRVARGGTQAQSPFGAGQRPRRGWRSRRIRRRGGQTGSVCPRRQLQRVARRRRQDTREPAALA